MILKVIQNLIIVGIILYCMIVITYSIIRMRCELCGGVAKQNESTDIEFIVICEYCSGGI